MRALCLALLLLAVPALAQQIGLRGRVVDQDGRPLADVAVCLIDRKADPFVTKDALQQELVRTGDDGRYVYQHPGPLDATRHRLLFVRRGRVHVLAPLHARDGWPVVLPRAHTLAGRVVDHLGKPVANVRVEARDWLWQARYRSNEAAIDWLPVPRTAVRTNERGRFILPGTMSSAVQLVVGDAFLRSNPVALGDPIELILPAKGVDRPGGRYRSGLRKLADTADPEAQQKMVGRATMGALPVYGLSVRFEAQPLPNAKARPGSNGAPVYHGSVPIAADGSFHVSLAPGRHTPKLVLPRAFRHGPPDLLELEPVEIKEGQDTLSLDLRNRLPVQVTGLVRSFVPAGRLVVGAAVKYKVRGQCYGFAHYECALATVAPDGSFAVSVPPGDCTLFVLDLWTGMMLHREPSRVLATGDAPKLELDVVAGACDVKLLGRVPELSWLEIQVPNEWVPNGIDRISTFGHEYTKRIGCMIPPGTSDVRLYLPPIATELWFVRSAQGDLELPHGDVSVDIEARQVAAVKIELPK